MENNCNKYEAYFIFKSDEDFLNHVANCPDCQVEHEKMQKVSSLISEVRPYFLAEKQRKNKIKQTAPIRAESLSCKNNINFLHRDR